MKNVLLLCARQAGRQSGRNYNGNGSGTGLITLLFILYAPTMSRLHGSMEESLMLLSTMCLPIQYFGGTVSIMTATRDGGPSPPPVI